VRTSLRIQWGAWECPHNNKKNRKRQTMSPQQTECIENIKILCEAAIAGAKSYEDVIEQIDIIMLDCPHP
jgi:hypothetical protein